MISSNRAEPHVSHPGRPHAHRFWMNFPASKLQRINHGAQLSQTIDMGEHTLACSNFFRIFRLCQQRERSPVQTAAPRSSSMTCHPANHAPAARSYATTAIRRSACNLAAPLKPALGQTAPQANEHCGTSAAYPPPSQKALAVLLHAGGAWPNFWPQQTSPPARPNSCLFARHTSARRPNSAPSARSPCDLLFMSLVVG